MKNEALIVVDIQNDFLPGGTLPVPEGDAVIPVVNKLQDCFELVIATQDWHPRDHVSFASNHAGRSHPAASPNAAPAARSRSSSGSPRTPRAVPGCRPGQCIA